MSRKDENPSPVDIANALLEAADVAKVNRIADAVFDTLKRFPPNADVLLALTVIVGKGALLMDHDYDVDQLCKALHLIILNEATDGSMSKTRGNA